MFDAAWDRPAGMMLRLAITLSLAMLGSPAVGMREKDVQDCLCHGKTEVQLPSDARADCIQEGFAIEIDRTSKWAEAIGQALHYSAQTGYAAKIILFCDEEQGHCLADRLRLEETIAAFSLPIALELHDAGSLAAECPID